MVKRIGHVNSLNWDLSITKCDYQSSAFLLLLSLNSMGRELKKRYDNHDLIQPRYVRQVSSCPLCISENSISEGTPLRKWLSQNVSRSI